MEIKNVPVGSIKPYEKNPRKNEAGVEKVANSIREFGFKQPIVVDRNGVIIAGHTRYKAALSLKLKEVPVLYATDLTDDQVKAYRLADNKTNEFSEWDDDLLSAELKELLNLNFDMAQFGFADEESGEPYTNKIDAPQYEITGEEPVVSELADTKTADEIEKEIAGADITEKQKAFLVMAAKRHIVFNYAKIAEYYAHQDKQMQKLMERSALVVIDYDDAIKYGYALLSGSITEMAAEDG